MFDAAFLGTCLQLARQSRMDLEVTLEVQDKDLYDNEGELLCRALEFVGKWECRWSESAYVSHARASCNVLSMVLEDLQKWGQSWQLFSLDLRDLKEGGEALLMAEICCKIGFMPALDILRLRMDELQHEGPWARYIPTSVGCRARWNWVKELEVDGSSTVCLMLLAICPSLDSATLTLQYEDDRQPGRTIHAGSLRQLKVDVVDGDVVQLFKRMTSPGLEYLEVNVGMMEFFDAQSARTIEDAVVEFVLGADGPVEGKFAGASTAVFQALKEKGLLTFDLVEKTKH
ncbi:hypothetical protein PM082_009196 [Marasmius tenuissimus]|nr:hypothetical protein PM082_009196 [Marasmius tenuissimus]